MARAITLVDLQWILWNFWEGFGACIIALSMATHAIVWKILPCAGSFLLLFYTKRLYFRNTKGGTFVINSLKILWKPAMALITLSLQDATSCKDFLFDNLQHHAKVENCKQILSDTKQVAQWSKHLLESQVIILIFTKQTRGLGLCSVKNM